jgi:hypothetical protein
MQPHDPGLVIHHDPRNERYLLVDSLPRLAVARRGPAEFTPKTRRHRQYAYFDQGQTPECTGYGSVTLLATADPYNKPPLTGHDWYLKNVAFDRAAGRYYDGGATVTAAMEVGRQLGFYTEYRWSYTMRTMQEAILKGALIAGTYWYPSMFERDKEGIVKAPSASAVTDDGHLYTINGYDAKRDLWRVPNTWGDGDYFIPGDLMYRLVREEGEIAQPSEIKVVPARKVAA